MSHEEKNIYNIALQSLFFLLFSFDILLFFIVFVSFIILVCIDIDVSHSFLVVFFDVLIFAILVLIVSCAEVVNELCNIGFIFVLVSNDCWF